MKIYTFSDKRPDFILKQKQSFDKFILDNFEYIVINNGSSEQLKNEIYNICIKNNINHIFVENPIHDNANIACAYPINQILSKYIKLEKDADISGIIDSDMFFVKDVCIKDLISDNELFALKQIRGNVNYIWNGVFFINHKEIKNINELDFGYGVINGFNIDVGGNTYFYFKKNPLCKLKEIFHTSHIHKKNNNLDVIPPELIPFYNEEYCFELLENCILHYGSGSNWKLQSKEYHEVKTKALDTFLKISYAKKLTWNKNNYIFEKNCWNNIINHDL